MNLVLTSLFCSAKVWVPQRTSPPLVPIITMYLAITDQFGEVLSIKFLIYIVGSFITLSPIGYNKLLEVKD
jgi:hypothetical protein